MRKILLLVLLSLFIIPIAQATEVVFVSKYSSRSMDDTDTFNYYNKLVDRFDSGNVHIVQDSDVVENTSTWQDAYDDSSLVFVMSLSEDVLVTKTDKFCGNLSVVKSDLKGIIFAGNSTMKSSRYHSCLYDSTFALVTASSPNTRLLNDTVFITEGHEVTSGYTSSSPYKLGENYTIYVVKSLLKSGSPLGNVTGDPDGSGGVGFKNYTFLAVWEELTYRAATWGINSSDISGCASCLGWNIFDQLLGWASDTESMGFEIWTNKEFFIPGETISITITANVDIAALDGNITYPEETDQKLTFAGSGKEWTSQYPLYNEDPNGEYNITIKTGSVIKTLNISVDAFDIELTMVNRTDVTEITVRVINMNDAIIDDADVEINVTSPDEEVKTYSEQSGYFTINYYPEITGVYEVKVLAIDPYGRSEELEDVVILVSEPDIILNPDKLETTVNTAGDVQGSLNIRNNGVDRLTNIHASRGGDILSWIEFTERELGYLKPDESTTLEFVITVPDVAEGNHTGIITIITDQGSKEVSVTVEMKYAGELLVTPSNWEEWSKIGEVKSKNFAFKNTGRGDLSIESVKVLGDLSYYSTLGAYPDKLTIGQTKMVKLDIDTATAQVSDVKEKISGTLEITTNQGRESPVPIEITFVANMENKVGALSVDIDGIENDLASLQVKNIDVSDLEDDLVDIEAELEAATLMYTQGSFENSLSSYQQALEKIDNLKDEINDTNEQLRKSESNFVRNVVIIFFVIAIFAVGVVVFMRRRQGKKYDWLYKKWDKK